jgi:hypothetical protein
MTPLREWSREFFLMSLYFGECASRRSVIAELKKERKHIEPAEPLAKSSKSSMEFKHEWYDEEPASTTMHLVPAAADDASPTQSAAADDASPTQSSTPAPEFEAWQTQDSRHYSAVKQQRKGARSSPRSSMCVSTRHSLTRFLITPNAVHRKHHIAQKSRIEVPLQWIGVQGTVEILQIPLYSHRISPRPTPKHLKGKARAAVLVEDPRPSSPGEEDASDEDDRAMR